MPTTIESLPLEILSVIARSLPRVPDILHLILAQRRFHNHLHYELIRIYADTVNRNQSRLPNYAYFYSPINHAVRTNDSKLMSTYLPLLRYHLPMIFGPDRFGGVTPLIVSVLHRNIVNVRTLLKYGDVTDCDVYTIMGLDPPAGSALLHAVAIGREDIVRVLLDAGADSYVPFLQFERGAPVYLAVILGHQQILRLLLARDRESLVEMNEKCQLSPAEVAGTRGLWDLVDLWGEETSCEVRRRITAVRAN